MKGIKLTSVSNINRVSKFITEMTKKDAMAPIVALEGAVVLGRTYQAYQRGKGDEARERFLEEITGSIVWLWGVKVLNEIGDTLLGKLLKSNKSFDVGTDKVLRTPFDNFMKKVAPKGLTGTHVALLKGAKVLSSIVLANLFIGFVVPKINHYITDTIRRDKHIKAEEKNKDSEKNTNSTNPAFKGGLAALNTFTNAIENTNTGKLLSTDFGIAGGRMYNARSKEERREIAFRDLGSIYFYMWAQGHVINLLNLIQTGSFSRLNPQSAETLSSHLTKFLEKNGGEMSVDEFRKAVLGNKASDIKLPESIIFETKQLSSLQKLMNNFIKTKSEPLQVVKVSDIEELFKDSNIRSRIQRMSKLQPKRMGQAVITKQQLIDAINIAEINNPEFLKQAFGEFTENAATDEFKYISESSTRKLKKEMEQYIEQLCKNAKDGKINKDFIDKFKNRNIKYSGTNFAAGFAVAALFLSTFIPKIQYYITRKTTGQNVFPGTYDFKEHAERPY